MKRCCTCKTEKPETEFARNKSTSDGLRSQCKACDRAYREANRDKHAEYKRAYREANREKLAEHKRAYYEANRDKHAEHMRAYREANREKLAEHRRAYYEANREKLAERERAYREANREKIAEYKREHHRHHTNALSDVYVKKRIAATLKTSASQVPPELVELKRQHLTLHRAVRNFEGAINEKRNQNHRPTPRHAGRRSQASDGR